MEDQASDLVVCVSALHLRSINAVDNLKIQELRMELEKRGLSTGTKTKPELEKHINELQRGIVSGPALLQSAPETLLADLGTKFHL